jgi:hypothetical protein
LAGCSDGAASLEASAVQHGDAGAHKKLRLGDLVLE